MAKKLPPTDAIVDEPWYAVQPQGWTIERRVVSKDGYPIQGMMGKLHFMSFAAAKAELLRRIDAEIANTKAKLAGLGLRKSAVRGFKAGDFNQIDNVIHEAPQKPQAALEDKSAEANDTKL